MILPILDDFGLGMSWFSIDTLNYAESMIFHDSQRMSTIIHVNP